MTHARHFFLETTIGRLTTTNRIVMAPMTRSRADDDSVVSELTATYYAQRASAGLVVTEGLYPTPMGKGYIRTPGIVTPEHVAAWRRVTDAVHARGGRIFAQIMHCGRISDPSFLPRGATPVAPSAVRPNGASYTDEGLVPHVTPRALDLGEIAGVVRDYAAATANALDAGFDGVELHAASGYLPEQFLSSSTNLRDDAYGGSIAGRARFVIEALEAMIFVAGRDRVGMKISPELGFNDISDATPLETYSHLTRAANELGIAYLHVAQARPDLPYHAALRPLFDGAFLAGGGFDPARGERMLAEGGADAIVFGAPFVANPDLPERIRRGAPLATPDESTFYTPGARGYTDYPTLDESPEAAA